MIAHRHRHLGQISRRLDRRLGNNINTRRSHRVSSCVHLAVTSGRSHVDRPMTSQAKFASPAIFDRLERASLHLCWSRFSGLNVARPSSDRLYKKLIVQPLVLEVAFFFRHPFLKTPMRLNSKFGHLVSPSDLLATLVLTN